MRAISLVLSLIVIGFGVYGLTIAGNSTEPGYWIGSIVVGLIWLIADIIAIKKHKSDMK